MEWTKVSIKTNSACVDGMTGILMDMGIFGVEIIDAKEMHKHFAESAGQWDYIDDSLINEKCCSESNVTVVFYLGMNNNSYELMTLFKERITSLACDDDMFKLLEITEELVDDQDWLHEWKKHFRPFNIGKILITPEWEIADNDADLVFTIDPGSAFGTGQHPSTAMCIQILQGIVRAGDVILDIGCGSGILSIISLLLGAGGVTACDIDPVATEVTKRNAILNPVDINDLQIFSGDVLTNSSLRQQISMKKYDIIIANIVADVIISLAPLIPSLIKPNGVFLASGIITERIDDVTFAIKASGFAQHEVTSIDGWCCVKAHG
ncbi:MAG: 50S ribosomal protein L11 methyltransferase [Defluviitaleaceae bacterium]|nr:50S ribosomal protein L11 methyltransferase [Defluviitaleaceae bacterium]